MISKLQFEILCYIYNDYDDPVPVSDVLKTSFCGQRNDPAKTSRVIEDMYNAGFIDTYGSVDPYSIDYGGDIHLTYKGRQAIIDYKMFVVRETYFQEQLDALKSASEAAQEQAEHNKELVESAKRIADAAVKEAEAARRIAFTAETEAESAKAEAKRSNRHSVISLCLAAIAILVSIVLHFI